MRFFTTKLIQEALESITKNIEKSSESKDMF